MFVHAQSSATGVVVSLGRRATGPARSPASAVPDLVRQRAAPGAPEPRRLASVAWMITRALARPCTCARRIVPALVGALAVVLALTLGSPRPLVRRPPPRAGPRRSRRPAPRRAPPPAAPPVGNAAPADALRLSLADPPQHAWQPGALRARPGRRPGAARPPVGRGRDRRRRRRLTSTPASSTDRRPRAGRGDRRAAGRASGATARSAVDTSERRRLDARRPRRPARPTARTRTSCARRCATGSTATTATIVTTEHAGHRRVPGRRLDGHRRPSPPTARRSCGTSAALTRRDAASPASSSGSARTRPSRGDAHGRTPTPRTVGVRDVTDGRGARTGSAACSSSRRRPTATHRPQALGRQASDYRQIAAVTTADHGGEHEQRLPRRPGVREPEGVRAARRRAAGRSCCVTRSPTSRPSPPRTTRCRPGWRRASPTTSATAAPACRRPSIVAELSDVGPRRRAARARCPSDDDYDGGNGDLVETYEQSWLAAHLIAERYGDEPAGRAVPRDAGRHRRWTRRGGTDKAFRVGARHLRSRSSRASGAPRSARSADGLVTAHARRASLRCSFSVCSLVGADRADDAVARRCPASVPGGPVGRGAAP